LRSIAQGALTSPTNNRPRSDGTLITKFAGCIRALSNQNRVYPILVTF
jgi:hypothetical protein